MSLQTQPDIRNLIAISREMTKLETEIHSQICEHLHSRNVRIEPNSDDRDVSAINKVYNSGGDGDLGVDPQAQATHLGIARA